MAQAAEKVLEFPSGGIADFYMEDHEIEALEREEAEQEFGSAGIATFEPIAHRMASYGRHGDDTVAHVETGELVIPKALIEDNPRLRASIFSHLEELGVEDPERYVVGSGANSINPDTGLPEFFFKKIKKAVSKIGKGVKKAFKSVAKVIKKAAPVIIPFALNAMFPGLGAIYSGALGSGIGTLVQGGSLKDAFKNALIGGAIGGATAGVQGAMGAKAAGKTISQGAFDEIAKQASFSNLQTAGQQLASGQFGQTGYDSIIGAQNTADLGNITASTSDVVDQATDISSKVTKQNISSGQNIEQMVTGDAYQAAKNANAPYDMVTDSYIGPNGVKIGRSTTLADLGAVPASAPVGPTMNPADQAYFGSGQISSAPTPTSGFQTLPPTTPTTMLERLQGAGETAMDYGRRGMDFLTGGTPTDTDIYKLAGEKMAAARKAGVSLTGDAAIQAATAELTPGMIRTYGPSALLASTAAYAGGMFDTPDSGEDDTADQMAALTGPNQYYEQNKDRFLLGGFTPKYAQGDVRVPTVYTQGVGQYNEGGGVFPRRVGGIMPNEGTPGKDSVRAMLMPGEFVMTTDAVKGLGNGNNDQGIQNMYQMMRGLEAKGKALA